jgi:16S rRNA (guanine527-N7)-methyltransferase
MTRLLFVTKMFHVKPRRRPDGVHRSDRAGGWSRHDDDEQSGSGVTSDDVRTTVFGDRRELAERFWGALATTAVERGLIGPREVDRLWDRHLLNCAVVAELVAEGASVVDVGSGAGLPGVVLAIARPDLRVTLVEPLLRRATFLGETVAALELDVAVVRGRAEDRQVVLDIGGADVVTARAVAPLAKLMGWCLPLAAEGGQVLALKGESAGEELERDRTSVVHAGGGELAVLECGVGVLETPTRVIRAVRQPPRNRKGRR